MAYKLTEHNAKLEENLQQNTDQFAHSLDLRMKELETKMETKQKDLSTNITEEVPNKVNQNWNDVVEPKQGVRGDLFWDPSWSVASCWCNATPRKTNSLPLAWDTSITSGVTDKYAARVPVPSPC